MTHGNIFGLVFNGTKAIQYLNDIGLSSNHLTFQCNYSEE